MRLSFLNLTCVAFSISASANPCSPAIGTPVPCDYDWWHQERKVVIGRASQVNLQCWDLGRLLLETTHGFMTQTRLLDQFKGLRTAFEGN
ncbi:hypothetical protein IQ07DRAFT_337264 [Pyrenochaeta sp. DS3sAY3a]|nr:hypothetical protein IQ07DRAFT_337264 [Pyrenochaeta sp. DS3sAY3a]